MTDFLSDFLIICPVCKDRGYLDGGFLDSGEWVDGTYIEKYFCGNKNCNYVWNSLEEEEEEDYETIWF